MFRPGDPTGKATRNELGVIYSALGHNCAQDLAARRIVLIIYESTFTIYSNITSVSSTG